MKIGIDKIGFYIPDQHLNLDILATARNIDPNKFKLGLMQSRFSVCSSHLNIIDMAIKSANSILSEQDFLAIDMLLVATESSLDYAKAAAVVVADKLNLKSSCLCLDLKQACFSLTAALQLAKNHINANPNAKVLVIGTDIAKYEPNTAAEATSGAGSVAILVSKDPKILQFTNKSVSYYEDVNDFVRPTGSKYPVVDGKLSVETYLKHFQICSALFLKTYPGHINQTSFCLHIPYVKLAYKALYDILQIPLSAMNRFLDSVKYNQQVGNIYTGSLYLHLIGLLENCPKLNIKEEILLFSYGSGATSKLFSLKLVKGYEEHLNTTYHQKMLEDSRPITVEEYEQAI